MYTEADLQEVIKQEARKFNKLLNEREHEISNLRDEIFKLKKQIRKLEKQIN